MRSSRTLSGERKTTSISFIFILVIVHVLTSATIARANLQSEPGPVGGASLGNRLLMEHYLHQLRLAESYFQKIAIGETVERSSVVRVLNRVRKDENELDELVRTEGAMPASFATKYRSAKDEIAHSLMVLDSGYDTLQRWHDTIDTINVTVHKILVKSDELATLSLKSRADRSTIYFMTRNLMVMQRMLGNLERISRPSSSERYVASINRVGRDAAMFGLVTKAFLNGDSRLGIDAVTQKNLRAKIVEIYKLNITGGFSAECSSLLSLSPVVLKFNEEIRQLDRSTGVLELAADS